MKVRKVVLTLNECSEIRILLSRKIDDVKKKLDVLSSINSPDDFDSNLFSYWRENLDTLLCIFEKLCSSHIFEVDK